MFSEQDIKNALDGHFYQMLFGELGVRVVDLVPETPTAKSENGSIPRLQKGGPNSIDWSAADEIILEMRRAGAQYKDISRALGINKDSVRWRFHRLCQVLGVDPDQEGPSYKKYNPQIEAEIVKARNAGRTYQSIGEQYGMSKASVRTIYYRWYHRMNKEKAA